MFFALVVIAIFVAVSVYFYFRSERLQHDLVQQKRDTAQTRKSHKQLADTVASIGAKQQEFFTFRYNKVKEEAERKSPAILSDVKRISPLVTNYAAIFNACAGGKEQLKPTAQTYFENHKPGAYKDFLTYISGREKHVARMWSSNNLSGFMSLMESLLTEQQQALAKIKLVKKEEAPEENIEFHKFN
ncbi:hypothetical protein [Thalassotalea euphylliae]|uniref:Uncharacterized protein n=1 Tax=Thalassotalea euphylliae TaxID=1655234 RepID=A0A3E0UJQ7_9GAMM|nr:hypothetical protein [Thalassotalea euphylliae]REL37106.1 hypothetical protein DXX92_18280 [Thalassotalea euphylliae]